MRSKLRLGLPAVVVPSRAILWLAIKLRRCAGMGETTCPLQLP